MGKRNDLTSDSHSTSIVPAFGTGQVHTSLLTDSEFTQAMQKYFPTVKIEGFGPVTRFVGSIIQAANVHAAMRYSSKIEQKRMEAITSTSREQNKALVQIANAKREVELARISAEAQASIAKIEEWGETERLQIRLDHEYKMHAVDRYYDLEEQRIRSSERKHREMIRTQRRRDRQIDRYCRSVKSMCNRLLEKALAGDDLAMSGLITLQTHWANVLSSTRSQEEFLALADKL